ncbi:unnamed protein product [Leptosia nina]|uniref:BED-type domain-containing protein n=1 Tax=Leptosia nina TaxID=320188 RepID=A0AAV1K5I9_9NEOP
MIDGEEKFHIARRKSKHRSQKYRVAWEYDRTFAWWIAPDPDNSYKARCKICNKSITAEKQVLDKHAICKRHLKNWALKSESETLTLLKTYYLEIENVLC